MYLQKYLKYKNKYLELYKKLNQSGGKIQKKIYKDFRKYCKLLNNNQSYKWNFICKKFNENMKNKNININATYNAISNNVSINAKYSDEKTFNFTIDQFYFKDNGKQYIDAHYEPYLFHFLYQPIIFPFEDKCFYGLFSKNDNNIDDLKINICLAQILTDCGKHRCETWEKDQRKAYGHENCSIVEIINGFSDKYPSLRENDTIKDYIKQIEEKNEENKIKVINMLKDYVITLSQENNNKDILFVLYIVNNHMKAHNNMNILYNEAIYTKNEPNAKLYIDDYLKKNINGDILYSNQLNVTILNKVEECDSSCKIDNMEILPIYYNLYNNKRKRNLAKSKSERSSIKEESSRKSRKKERRRKKRRNEDIYIKKLIEQTKHNSDTNKIYENIIQIDKVIKNLRDYETNKDIVDKLYVDFENCP